MRGSVHDFLRGTMNQHAGGIRPWPSVTYEAQIGPSYASAVPPSIADLQPALDSRSQALVEAVTVDIVRFDAGTARSQPDIRNLLLMAEACASSRIEGLVSGALPAALAMAGETSDPVAALTAANAAAIQAAVAAGTPDSAGLRRAHEILLAGHAAASPGRFRDAQAWIGGSSPQNAAYVPPAAGRIWAAMNDLEAFLRREDIPVLVQAAVAHAQFETIHPFNDGNGRTGRAMVAGLLSARGITEEVILPISLGLRSATGAYFASLDAYRHGDIRPIINLFAEAAGTGLDGGRRLGEEVQRIRSLHAVAGRNFPPNIRRVLDLLPAHPVLTAEKVAALVKVSTATAYRFTETLERSGITVPAGKVRGVKVWEAPEITAAMDSLLARSP